MFNRFMKLGQKKASKPDGNGSKNVSRPSDQQAVAAAAAATTAAPPPPFNPVIEGLPKFKDVHSSERLNLFVRKTQLCCVVCDFTNNNSKPRDKETKAKTLIELVEFIQTDSSRMNETMQENLMRMISINIFRCLPPASYENTGCLPGGSDPEEDEPYMEPAWPHLQFVYELLLRYIVSCDRDIKTAKRFIDHTFVLKLIDLFDSEDPRERDYLKMVLHRIYGKFMVHRPYIRSVINNVFYRFIFETERHCGIGELLEILGSIINGLALPMKEEHKLFLVRALLPLHKAKNMSWYHQQLSYCVIQFVEKDFTLADIVIKALLKFWPVTNCQKEVLFLGELEEVLEATQLPEFQEVMLPLFRQIARCLNSSHFQVDHLS